MKFHGHRHLSNVLNQPDTICTNQIILSIKYVLFRLIKCGVSHITSFSCENKIN